MRCVITVLALLVCATTAAGAQTAPSRGPVAEKSPLVARVIGMVPGAGHIYAGEPGRGWAYMGATGGLFLLGSAAVVADCTMSTGPQEDCGTVTGDVVAASIIALWGWSIYDAGRAAHRTNERRRHARVSVGVTPAEGRMPGPPRMRATVGITLALATH